MTRSQLVLLVSRFCQSLFRSLNLNSKCSKQTIKSNSTCLSSNVYEKIQTCPTCSLKRFHPCFNLFKLTKHLHPIHRRNFIPEALYLGAYGGFLGLWIQRGPPNSTRSRNTWIFCLFFLICSFRLLLIINLQKALFSFNPVHNLHVYPIVYRVLYLPWWFFGVC